MIPSVKKRPEQLTFEILETKPQLNNVVTTSHDLIFTQSDLSIMQQRIIYYLISMVQPEDNDFKNYRFRASDLAELLGFKGQSYYKRTEEAIDSLMSKQIVRYSKDGNRVEKIQWVQKATYFKNIGTIEIRLSDDLAEYLLDLKKSFVSTQLKVLLQFNSLFSHKFYQFVKSHGWKNKPIKYKSDNFENDEWRSWGVLKIDEIRFMFDLQDSYAETKNIKRRILEPAIKEINKLSEFEVAYDVYKRIGKRTIESYAFYIRRKTGNNADEHIRIDVENTINSLMKNGIRKGKAVKLTKDYDFYYLQSNLLYALNNIPLDVTNPAGFIIKSIEDNYANVDETPIAVDFEDPLVPLINNSLFNFSNLLDDENKKTNLKMNDSLSSYKKDELEKIKNSESTLEELKEKRTEYILKMLDDIQRGRASANLPPIQYEEIENREIRDAIISLSISHAPISENEEDPFSQQFINHPDQTIFNF